MNKPRPPPTRLPKQTSSCDNLLLPKKGWWRPTEPGWVRFLLYLGVASKESHCDKWSGDENRQEWGTLRCHSKDNNNTEENVTTGHCWGSFIGSETLLNCLCFVRIFLLLCVVKYSSRLPESDDYCWSQQCSWDTFESLQLGSLPPDSKAVWTVTDCVWCCCCLFFSLKATWLCDFWIAVSN